MSNTFDINAFNLATYAALNDHECADKFNEGIDFVTKVAENHYRIPDANFGDVSKSEVLGMIVDDISDTVLRVLDEDPKLFIEQEEKL